MPRTKAAKRTKATDKQIIEPAAIRAAIYLRVSTEEQAREGFGLDVQLQRCQAMAVVKGWQVAPDDVFADKGISGTKTEVDRPRLKALMEAVESGEIKAVIVLALDRLGRKSAIILDLVERMNEAGAEIVSCKESLDTTTPSGRFVLTIFAAVAQLERDNTVERTGGGRDTRGRLDGEMGGRLPYGYRRARDAVTGKATGVEIDRATAPIVRHIFMLRKRRRKTLEEIAEELNAAGRVTPRGGQCWRPSTVASILANEFIYRGGTRGESARTWPSILG